MKVFVKLVSPCSSVKTKASSFSLDLATPMDSCVSPPSTSSHTQAYCSVFSFQPMNTVAFVLRFALSFFSARLCGTAGNDDGAPTLHQSHASRLASPLSPASATCQQDGRAKGN